VEFYNFSIQDIIKTKLSKEELGWLTQTKSLTGLLNDVQKVWESCEEKKKHRITRFLQRFSGGVLKRLERFSSVIETLVSSNPNMAALIWGGMKLVLMVTNPDILIHN